MRKIDENVQSKFSTIWNWPWTLLKCSAFVSYVTLLKSWLKYTLEMLSEIEDRQKTFFGSCRKLRPPEREDEFNGIRNDFQKVQ